jgi:hypothetical protein
MGDHGSGERVEDDILDTRIRARIQPTRRYAYFFSTSEGCCLPGTDIEGYSGYGLDDPGRVFSFWLGWDADICRPALIHWYEAAPSPGWENDAEYRRARARVGLSEGHAARQESC